MKVSNSTNRLKASTLLVVMCLGTVALVILASTMAWTSGTVALTDDAVRHSVAMAAAEAATESAMSEIAVDFAREGAGVLNAKMNTYKARVPKSSEHSHWGKFKFSNGKGKKNEVNIELVAPWSADTPLISQYEGLKGYAATYRITANAADPGARRNLTGAVSQDIQLALIPIFQFAIFYNLDMEVNPGANMGISGRTHGNVNIFLNPSAALTFYGDVTAAGEIFPWKKPGDPTIRSGGSVSLGSEHDSGVMSLNIPIGTANTPEAVRQIVEIPEKNDTSTELGKQRFYNNADLVIIVENSGVTARGGGMSSGKGVNLKWSAVSNFMVLGDSFYDTREDKTVALTEINVGKFVQWNAITTNALKNALKRDINSIYVADLRTENSSTLRGIRLVNGGSLPPLGLTVATPNPLYVQGHYNASGTSIGSHNTSNTKPAALIADAITILSTSWNDANSSKGLSSRTAGATTVNAAFMAGIVETGSGYYSGGVENLPRFLESWSNKLLHYNGSMVVLYRSTHATRPWRGTGSPANIYDPPNRDWGFDINFLDPAKLPPLTPSVRAVIRGQWNTAAPSNS